MPERTACAERIALVVSELRPGGMERVVVHLAREWQRLCRTPLIVCLQRAGALAGEVQAAGVPLQAIGSLRGRDVLGLVRLARVLRRFGPSVINVHDYSSLPYVALARRLGARAPVVFTAHGLLYEAPDRLRRRHTRASRCLAGITAVSPEVADRHREYVGWERGISVIPNGVPPKEATPDARQRVRQELGIGPEQFLWLAAGNARPEKGFEDLLTAAAALRDPDAGSGSAVAIAGRIGDDPYGQRLRQQREKARLSEAVRFLGFQSDMASLYAAADAFVLSSRSEGMPMVVLEAMMAGLPIVATRVGGVSSVVPDAAGVLVPPGDPAELARVMAELADDPDRRAAMGRAAERHARATYSAERMALGYLKVFDELVTAAPRR